jgi:broad specificity phosphatase PhoE
LLTETLWVFLRHGQSFANAEGWLSGWRDVALTPEGERQARAAGEKLAELPVRRVLASDLGRAVRTAELAIAGHPTFPGAFHRVPELRERHMGVLEGVPFVEVRDDGRLDRWLRPWDVGPPGGESSAVAVCRALAALRRWDDGTPTLVVAHGSLLRALIGVLDGVPTSDIGQLPTTPNADPVIRRIPRGCRVPACPDP